MKSEALTGRHIVITRPIEQSANLRTQLERFGATVIDFPVIEIAALDDYSDLLRWRSQLGMFDYAFFVSPNAVAFALEQLPRPLWSPGVRAIAVGPATAEALRAAGFDQVIVPETRFDSEGLLELPALQAAEVGGKRVLVLRGNGGRELLAQTLAERGAMVETASCYQRRQAQLDPAALLGADAVDGLVFSSSEGVEFFCGILGDQGRALLQRIPVFVPHPRIGAAAASHGAVRVILTAPGDAGIASTVAIRLERSR